jgi:hypothetical protein
MLRVVECDHFLYHPSSSSHLTIHPSADDESGDAHTEGRGGELAFQEVHSIGFIDRFSQNLVAPSS